MKTQLHLINTAVRAAVQRESPITPFIPLTYLSHPSHIPLTSLLTPSHIALTSLSPPSHLALISLLTPS